MTHDCDDDDCGRLPPRRLQPLLDLTGITLSMVAEIAEAVGDAFGAAGNLVAAHANYREDRHKFAEQVGLEIEMLTEPEEGS